jgi:hypothetical protein
MSSPFIQECIRQQENARVVIDMPGRRPPAIEGLYYYPPEELTRDVLEDQGLLMDVETRLRDISPSLDSVKAFLPPDAIKVSIGLTLEKCGYTVEDFKHCPKLQQALATVQELDRRFQGYFSLYIYSPINSEPGYV